MKRNLLLASALGFLAACYSTQQSACGTGPTPQPSPTPTASPTPTPSPSATPGATPTATPILCSLPPSFGTSCKDGVRTFGPLILEVQATLGPHTSELAYVAALAHALRAKGVCAHTGTPLSPDEVGLKSSNATSETWDVWNAGNYPQSLYVHTCTPAQF